ncbi:MAG TPA: SDR family oxidoreductase [Rhodocyclaceae bacterium]|nr:SDR family oxidoreductase [Rhodocyclaceae bacterium]
MTQGPFLNTTDAEWDELVAVNLTGVFNCIRAVAPSMVAHGKGNIINIASVAAMKGGGALGNTWYGSTKAAVVALTKGLSRELGPNGIRVNAIAPGVVETDMVKDSLTPKIRQRILARFPLARLATKEDVANLAVFLASDLSSFITGQTIAVDGGFLNT